jgi:membrane-associated phospholipid phosphatase
MHYPTDVLAGAVLWIAYAIIAIRASKYMLKIK